MIRSIVKSIDWKWIGISYIIAFVFFRFSCIYKIEL